MLELVNIKGGYANNQNILNGINLTVQKGEIIAILGQNGSGKSTLAKAIINALDIRSGKVFFKKQNISDYAINLMPKLGISTFNQGGSVFPNLTIKQHLRLFSKENLVFLNDVSFDVLNNKANIAAGLLSGGERNLLAIVMALAHKPALLILDEPTAGLSPIAASNMYIVLEKLRKDGLTIILIEQNIQKAIHFSDKVEVLQNGQILKTIQYTDKEKMIKEVEKIFF